MNDVGGNVLLAHRVRQELEQWAVIVL